MWMPGLTPAYARGANTPRQPARFQPSRARARFEAFDNAFEATGEKTFRGINKLGRGVEYVALCALYTGAMFAIGMALMRGLQEQTNSLCEARGYDTKTHESSLSRFDAQCFYSHDFSNRLNGLILLGGKGAFGGLVGLAFSSNMQTVTWREPGTAPAPRKAGVTR